MTDDKPNAPPATGWPQLDDPKLLEDIIDVISAEGRVERSKIVPEATLDSLGLASMDVVTVLMGIEDKLGVYMPMDSDLMSARNLAELMATIVKAAHGSSRTGTRTDAG